MYLGKGKDPTPTLSGASTETFKVTVMRSAQNYFALCPGNCPGMFMNCMWLALSLLQVAAVEEQKTPSSQSPGRISGQVRAETHNF